MSERNRLAMLVLAVAALGSGHAGAALGGTEQPPGGLGPAAPSATQLLAHEQAGVVRFARKLLGVPYSYGGISPSSGFDCSGFTRFVYAHFGVDLPHDSVGQFDAGRRVARASLQPGDLVFFDGLGHVGLYIGGGRFIHAPHSGSSVSVESLDGWYASRYDGARRLI